MTRQSVERPRERGSAASSASREHRPHVSKQWWLLLGSIAGIAVAVFLVLSLAVSGTGKALSVLNTDDFHALAIHPANSNVVYFGHHNGVMRSDDGGRSWQPLVDKRNFDAMALAVSHAEPQRIYALGHDVFQISNDGGQTWQAAVADLPGTDIHGFAMSTDSADRLYAFVVGHGAFESTDSGRTWQKLPGPLPPDVMALAAAHDTLYAGSMRSGVLRSIDGGKTWSSANDGLGSSRVVAVAVDPSSSKTVYAGADSGLYKSTDGGMTWAKTTFPGQNAVTVAVSRSNPNVVMAIEFAGERVGQVYRSGDGGITWGGD